MNEKNRGINDMNKIDIPESRYDFGDPYDKYDLNFKHALRRGWVTSNGNITEAGHMELKRRKPTAINELREKDGAGTLMEKADKLAEQKREAKKEKRGKEELETAHRKLLLLLRLRSQRDYGKHHIKQTYTENGYGVTVANLGGKGVLFSADGETPIEACEAAIEACRVFNFQK